MGLSPHQAVLVNGNGRGPVPFDLVLTPPAAPPQPEWRRRQSIIRIREPHECLLLRCYSADALSRRARLITALGLAALAGGPVALQLWNQGVGSGGFASPVGGKRWYSTRPGFFEATGVRDPELSPLGTVFNWTEGNATTFRFDRLDRSVPAIVTLRILGVEESSGGAAEVVLAVDGVEAKRLPTPLVPRRVSVDLPRRQTRGAVVSLRVEGSVGVMVENVRLTAAEGSLPVPIEAVGAAALVSLSTYAAVLLGGGSPWLALFSALTHAIAAGWLSVAGGAFLGPYSERLARFAAASLMLSLAASRVSDPRWRKAWIAVLWVAIMKLAILGHPGVQDGDAAGHANNLGRVLSGDWFFTSDTPPPAISFPYPQGLSAAALPFSGLPQDQWVSLLRAIVVATETIGAAVFSFVIASLSTPAVGATTFVLMALQPEGVLVLFIGNLSNLFSNPLLIVGCSLLIIRRAALASFMLLGGFLSHFATLLLGAPLSLALALLPGRPRDSVVTRIAPVLAALTMSFVLYYRHFVSVFAEAWNRISDVSGAAAVGPMTAPVSDKLSRMSGGGDWWITAVLMISVAIGIATWPKDRQSLARILAVWALVVAGFVLLGLFTPILVRSALPGRPVVAALSASGICALWPMGSWRRVAAGSLVFLPAAGSWVLTLGFY